MKEKKKINFWDRGINQEDGMDIMETILLFKASFKRQNYKINDLMDEMHSYNIEADVEDFYNQFIEPYLKEVKNMNKTNMKLMRYLMFKLLGE